MLSCRWWCVTGKIQYDAPPLSSRAVRRTLRSAGQGQDLGVRWANHQPHLLERISQESRHQPSVQMLTFLSMSNIRRIRLQHTCTPMRARNRAQENNKQILYNVWTQVLVRNFLRKPDRLDATVIETQSLYSPSIVALALTQLPALLALGFWGKTPA